MDRTKQIIKFLQDKFELPPSTKVSLLRSYTNNVYQVDAINEKYLFKIYGKNWRTEEELLFEIDLLNTLKTMSVKVAEPVIGKDRKFLYSIDNGQYAILFEWANGDKPAPPFNSSDRELLGKSIAKIHLATNGFKSSHHRPVLNIDYLIKKPLHTILSFCSDNSQKSFFTQTSQDLEKYIGDFVAKGLDFGIVHADVTFDNVHITKDREMIFYDFDSGGPGWRAIDLQGWAVFDPKNASKQQDFLKGYRTVREVKEIDIKAAPNLHAANEFWGIALDLARRVSKQGEPAVANYLDEKGKEMQGFMEYFKTTHDR